MNEPTRVIKQMIERYIDNYGIPALGNILVSILNKKERQILATQLNDGDDAVDPTEEEQTA